MVSSPHDTSSPTIHSTTSPTIQALFAHQSPSTFSASLDLGCFSTAATFSAPQSPFSLRHDPLSVFDCLLESEHQGQSLAPADAQSFDDFALPPLKDATGLSIPLTDRQPIRPSDASVDNGDLNLTGISPIALLSTRPIIHDAIQWSADNLIAIVGALDIDIVDAKTSGSPELSKIQTMQAPIPGVTLSMSASNVAARWSPPGSFGRRGCCIMVLMSDGGAFVFTRSEVMPGTWHKVLSIPAPSSSQISAVQWFPETIGNRAIVVAGTADGRISFFSASLEDDTFQQTQPDFLVADGAHVLSITVSSINEGGVLMAVASGGSNIHIFRISADLACAHLHQIKGSSPISLVSNMTFSRQDTKGHIRLASAMGSSLSIATVAIDKGIVVGETSHPHGHIGMVSGLVWGPDATSLISSSSMGPLRSWSINTGGVMEAALPGSCPVLGIERLASRDTFSGDDDGNLSFYIKGFVGLSASPDDLLAGVLVPVITTTTSGRSGKASTRRGLSFALYGVAMSQDLQQIVDAIYHSGVHYLVNVHRWLELCPSPDSILSMVAEREAHYTTLASLVSSASSVDARLALRSANLLRYCLQSRLLISNEEIDKHAMQICDNVRLLVHARIHDILQQFITIAGKACLPAISPTWMKTVAILSRWASRSSESLLNDVGTIAEQALASIQFESPLEECCPYCSSLVEMSDLFAECCGNNHKLYRSRETFLVMADTWNRSCLICEGRSSERPLQAGDVEFGVMTGLTGCSICRLHTPLSKVS